MKKVFILSIIFLIIFCSCTNNQSNENSTTITTQADGVGELTVVKIDGCEYFQNYTRDGHYVYTHKGNCTNPIHKCKCGDSL